MKVFTLVTRRRNRHDASEAEYIRIRTFAQQESYASPPYRARYNMTDMSEVFSTQITYALGAFATCPLTMLLGASYNPSSHRSNRSLYELHDTIYDIRASGLRSHLLAG